MALRLAAMLVFFMVLFVSVIYNITQSNILGVSITGNVGLFILYIDSVLYERGPHGSTK